MFEWVEFSDKYDSYRVLATTLQLYIAMNILQYSDTDNAVPSCNL